MVTRIYILLLACAAGLLSGPAIAAQSVDNSQTGETRLQSEQQKPAQLQSDQQQSGQKQSDQKQSNQKQSDQKQSDQKQSDQKQSDQKQSDQNKSNQNKSGQQHSHQASSNESQSSGQGQKSAETKAPVGEEGQSYLLAAQMPSQVLATSLIGLTIRNKAEKIGTVSDVILNKNYKLVGFVVDMSGATGTIQKSVGIARSAVKKIDPAQGVITVTVKKEQLQSVRNYATQKDLSEHNNLQ